MSIRVELFGIPRERAGIGETTAEGCRLSEVLADLAARFPQLAQSCFVEGRFQPGYIGNINGQRFINDPQTLLHPGDALIILSADAGG